MKSYHDELKTTALCLLEKIQRSATGGDAMTYAQALLNLSNAHAKFRDSDCLLFVEQ